MKLLNRLILVLLGVLFALELAHAETAGDLNTQGRASFIARDGYNLFLGNEGDDDFVVVQNNVTTFSIDGATGAVTFSGTLTPTLANNTYLKAKNAAGSANIDVLKVDATDDTVLNADTGDSIKLAVGGVNQFVLLGTGILPNFDGDSTTANLGSSASGFKNIYLSDATRRAQIFVSDGLYVSYPSGQGIFFREASTDRWSITATTGAFTPGANNSYDIGTTALAVRATYSNILQGATGANTEIKSRNGNVDIYTIGSDSAPLRIWRFLSTGNIEQDTTNGGSIILGKTGANLTPILVGTSAIDSDISGISSTHPGILINQAANVSDSVVLVGNGAQSLAPWFRFYKTRATAPATDANTIVASGDEVGRFAFAAADGVTYRNAAYIVVTVDGTPGSSDMPGAIDFGTTPDGSAIPASVLKLGQDKLAQFTGQIRSSATSDLGWSAVNAANQACNTTCTSACVFGMNTGALGNFVGCADATADTCICAGSS